MLQSKAAAWRFHHANRDRNQRRGKFLPPKQQGPAIRIAGPLPQILRFCLDIVVPQILEPFLPA